LPSSPNPNVSGEYHEYHVPKEALKLYYPEENYNYYGFNVAPKIKNSNKLILKQIKEKHITKSNTLFIISAEFSLSGEGSLKYNENYNLENTMTKIQ
tara:strand:+ start:201 stop:491 length:291 start_codon:yes stop_codon:yes gene_type:complete